MTTEKLCGSCRGKLQFMKRENVQLGRTGLLFGSLSNLVSGAQDVEFWVCPDCRKLELFLPEDGEVEMQGGIAQITCPVCGAEYDMDAPKCPCCGAKNEAW